MTRRVYRQDDGQLAFCQQGDHLHDAQTGVAVYYIAWGYVYPVGGGAIEFYVRDGKFHTPDRTIVYYYG